MLKIITARDKTIEELRETLSVPRQHFKHIERLTVDQIVQQRAAILKEKSEEMGIPVENLIQTMYYNTTRKMAMKQVDEGLAEESGDEGVAQSEPGKENGKS